jgi:YHS domain-containing protein
MLRAIILALVTVFILAVFRMIAGALSKGFAEMMDSEKRPQPGTPPPPPPPRSANATPSGGTLRRDPVCGMFIPESQAHTRTVRGETLYFCSEECRDRYAV